MEGEQKAIGESFSSFSEVLDEKFGEGKTIRYWPEKGRYYAFIHPKKMHGALWEVIDGKYDSQK